jgi:hypothetical protein
MICQLNPPLEVFIPHQNKKCYAYFLIDYGIDNEVWCCADQATGEIWFYQTKYVRMAPNITFGRQLPATSG